MSEAAQSTEGVAGVQLAQAYRGRLHGHVPVD